MGACLRTAFTFDLELLFQMSCMLGTVVLMFCRDHPSRWWCSDGAGVKVLEYLERELYLSEAPEKVQMLPDHHHHESRSGPVRWSPLFEGVQSV